MSALENQSINYQIARMAAPDGSEQLTLVITTPLGQCSFWLASKETYRAAAKELHDTIIKAGNDMSKLVTGNGVRPGKA